MSDDENRGATGDDRPGSYPRGGAPSIAAPAPAWSRLPLELRQRPNWLLAMPDPTGALKVPVSMNGHGTLIEGKVNEPRTWLPFDAVVWKVQRGDQRLGLGYVLCAGQGIFCIDIDIKNHVNRPDEPGRWTTAAAIEEAVRLVAAFDTYGERSQSGQGLHLWGHGEMPDGGKGRKNGIYEFYSQERFIACTGDVYMDRPMRDLQRQLTNIVKNLPKSSERYDLVEVPARKTDEQVLAGIWHWRQKGEQFRQLWHGYRPDGTLMWDAKGKWIERKLYPSQNEADFALLGLLCLTLQSNEQVKRLFRMSALGQRLKRKPNPDAYLNFSLSGLRPEYGTTVAYTLK